MSKMNLKSTLWTLAFAVAAVSCSDELEEGGGTGTGNEENGEGVYVTVNVGMASGPTTKAGELGDNDLEDSDVESAVHDVNIFLVQVTPGQDYTGMTGNDISYVNAVGNPTISSGYSTDIQSATGSILHHDLEATVRVSVPDLDQWYHVITVVNAGDDLGFTTLEQLRDYLQTTAWSGKNKYDETGKEGAHNFVMSTHQMYQNNVGGSELHVTAANTDPSNPAETTVYVERLAARIDMNFASELVSEGGASLESDDNSYDNNDKVWITGYQVVNQMKGGTYMLKRVTDYKQTTSVTASIPTSPTLTYLGDEIWQEGAYNYVIDPWTLNKKADDSGNFPKEIRNSGAYYSGSAGNYTKTEANNSMPPYNLAKDLYINHFWEGLNTPEFLNFNSVDGIQTTNGSFTPLLYVQENTADAAQQKKGFTTGVIFEAEYKPQYVSLYKEDAGGGSPRVVDNETYTAGNAFFVADYEHNNWANRKLASDMRTIAALGLKESADETIVKAMFTDGTPDWGEKGKDDVQTVVSGMSGGPLVEAFHDYLQGVLDASESLDDNAKATLTWKAFVEASHSTSEDNKIPYVPTADELANGISGDPGKTAPVVREELLTNYNIAYYAAGTKGGKNYLKYWIKHEPNGTDDDPMGVMEFAIVRNNVYQLGVTGVSGLGDPLPFTPGTDDPDDPVKEEEEVQILVRLYVRDWVKRSNSGIVL